MRSGFLFAALTLAGHWALIAKDEIQTARTTGGSVAIALRNSFQELIWPAEASRWVLFILVGGCVAWWLECRYRSNSFSGLREPAAESDFGSSLLRQGTVALIWLPVFIAMLIRILWGSVYLNREWTSTQATMVIGGLSIIMALMAAATPRCTNSANRLATKASTQRWLLSTAVLFAASGVVAMSGSFTYAAMLMTSVVSLGLCSLFVWRGNNGRWNVFPAGLIVLAAGFHLALARFFAELTLTDMLLLTASLWSSFSYAERERDASRPHWPTRVTTIVLTLSLALAAILHAAIPFAKSLAAPTGYDALK